MLIYWPSSSSFTTNTTLNSKLQYDLLYTHILTVVELQGAGLPNSNTSGFSTSLKELGSGCPPSPQLVSNSLPAEPQLENCTWVHFLLWYSMWSLKHVCCTFHFNFKPRLLFCFQGNTLPPGAIRNMFHFRALYFITLCYQHVCVSVCVCERNQNSPVFM